MLSNNIQKGADGLLVESFSDVILEDIYTTITTCKKKRCNGNLISNDGFCFSLWLKDGSGDAKPAGINTSHHCDVCHLDQPLGKTTITKELNKKSMFNDSGLGESLITRDLKIAYNLLDKLQQVINETENIKTENKESDNKIICRFENSFDHFIDRIKRQEPQIFKIFDDDKILNFDEMQKQIEISKKRNFELTTILRKVLTSRNFSRVLKFSDISNLTTDPKELSKLNSQKLDQAMTNNSELNVIFYTDSETAAAKAYDKTYMKVFGVAQ